MKGKVAIITGVTRGIGKEICLMLAVKGIHIVGAYNNNNKAAEQLQKKMEKHNTKFIPVSCDFTNPRKGKEIADIAIRQLGRIDFLINCAGVFYRTKFENISTTELEQVMSVNFTAPFILSQECAKHMLRNKMGKIVNISSLLGVRGYNYASHYVSAKAALIGLTKSLSQELAPYVNVNCILPGFIETTNLKHDTEEQRNNRIDKIPLKRVGVPADVASLVCFLVSAEANYITGESIEVSGGLKI